MIFIMISTGIYFVISGVLLITLLRSAARTSADWAAYTPLVNGPVPDTYPVWAHSRVAASAAYRSGASQSADHTVHHATEAI